MAKRLRKDQCLDWDIEPWASFAFHRNPGPVDFRVLRLQLRLSPEQCAELLHVSLYSVRRWESGSRKIPPMAYHMLRLLHEKNPFASMHKDWKGWQIGRDGNLYAPGGRYCFSASNLEAWWIESQAARAARKEATKLRAALTAAEQENTELRTLFVNHGVVEEIAAMQSRLAELVARLNTAKVIPMPSRTEKAKEKTA